jgi:hypothetical protein
MPTTTNNDEQMLLAEIDALRMQLNEQSNTFRGQTEQMHQLQVISDYGATILDHHFLPWQML